MAKICLSYDILTEYYGEGFTKNYLIKLLHTNYATNIQSHVGSSIYFDTTKHNCLEKWEEIIRTELPEGFYFTIAKIVVKDTEKATIRWKSKRGFKGRFDREVSKVKRTNPLL
jgi:hypothetical protein